MRHYIKLINLFSILLLTSCNEGASSAPDSADLTATSTQNIVVLGNVTTIPVVNNRAGLTYMVITNNSATQVTLQNAVVQYNNTSFTVTGSNQLVDTSACSTLDSQASCKVVIKARNIPSDYVIRMIFQGSDGNTYSGTQLISYTTTLTAFNGFTASSTNGILNRNGNNAVTISIPFILGDDYNDINLTGSNEHLTTSFICPNDIYSKGTLCTAFVTADNSISKTVDTENLSLTGMTDAIALPQTRTINLSVTQNTAGNLITSGSNVIISPATSSQIVTLVNTGTASITNMVIAPSYPVTIHNNSCLGSLRVGGSCAVQLSAASATINGQAPLYITYNNGQSTQSLSFNTIYILESQAPSFTLTYNGGSFANISTATGPAFLPVVVTNNGNVTLNNINFNQVSAQDTHMAYGNGNGNTCSLSGGTSLSPGSSCVLVISYSPTVVESGNLYIDTAATYTDNNNQSQTYLASLSVPYSAVTAATFITVGDFGVSASTIAAGSPWQILGNIPFSANTTGVTAVTSGGGHYLLGNSAGTTNLVLSSNTGAIWAPAGTTGLTAIAPHGLIYDGSNYYATGTGSKIVYTSTLSSGVTWSTGSANTLAVPQGLFYFPGTGYLATLAVGTQLFTSTTGITGWAAPTITGTAQQNGPALFSSTLAHYYTFGSAGFTASASTLNGTWTVSAANRPNNAVTAISGAVESAGFFVITSSTASVAQGGIWTTTNPTSVAYVQRYTATATTSALFSVAYGNGIYIAVGALGHIESSLNGTTWSDQTVGTQPYNYVYFDGNYFWAGGTDCTLKVSANGTNWFTPGLNSIALESSTYVAVGGFGGIYTSATTGFTTTETNWIQQVSPTTQQLNNVICTGGSICAIVGNSGVIITSVNMTTWNLQTSGTANNLNGIVCGPVNCVAVGNNGTILSSPDLINWTSQTSGITQNLMGISYFNGTYLAVGAGGVILLSKDGISWNAQTSGVSGQLNSIACNALVCIAAGNGALVYSTSQGFTWTSVTSAPITGSNFTSIAAFNGSYIAVGSTTAAAPQGIVAYSTGAAPTPWTTWASTLTPAFTATTVSPGLKGIYAW